MEVATSYRDLPDYFKALVDDSPGSIAVVERDSNGRFVRGFQMLGRAAHVAANSVPKIVAVDAGHLKGDWNGVMLTITCKDSDNKLIHVATAVTAKEDTESYQFLLRHAMKNPEMSAFLASPATTFFSDGFRGSAAAIKAVVPRAQHRTCVKHVINNLGQAVGLTGSTAIVQAARAAKKSVFASIMDNRVKPFKALAYEQLMQRSLPTWTHHASAQDTVILDQVTSNPAESTMHMVGGHARSLPPARLFQDVLAKTAAKCSARSKLLQHTHQTFTPFASNTFEQERVESKGMTISPCGNDIYIVKDDRRGGGNRVVVQFGDQASGSGPSMKCSGAFPVRYQIPCRHILAVAREERQMDAAMGLIHPGYRVRKYRLLYSDPAFLVMPPISDMLTPGKTLLSPAPVETPAGRPKKGPRVHKRIRSNVEFNSSTKYNMPMSAAYGLLDASNLPSSQPAGASSQPSVISLV